MRSLYLKQGMSFLTKCSIFPLFPPVPVLALLGALAVLVAGVPLLPGLLVLGLDLGLLVLGLAVLRSPAGSGERGPLLGCLALIRL